MDTIIVTSGQQFTDIDAFACGIAYTELLNLEGKEAKTIFPGTLNNSITNSIKNWKLEFLTKYNPIKKFSFVLVDISDLMEFANFVDDSKILEIYDHRYGFEEYWKTKLGKNSHIEMVGSCATLVWEEFVKRITPLKISTTSANLLLTAIISNTLNFRATVTTKRDRLAFTELKKYTNIPSNWVEKYFEEQDSEKLNNIYDAIVNDTKISAGPVIGQLEMWNSKILFERCLPDIEKAMNSFGKDEWYLTSPSISDGINYLFAKNAQVKKLLEKNLEAKFEGDIGKTKKLWLRKEIVRKFSENS